MTDSSPSMLDMEALDLEAESGGNLAAGADKEPAVFINFDRVPGSSEAHTFTAQLIELIELIEASEEKQRQRRRTAQNQQSFVEAVGSFAADLAVSVDEGSPRLLACSKDSTFYTDLPVGYRSFKSVYDGLIAQGLLEVVTRGSIQWDDFDGARAKYFGKRERLRTTPALLDKLRQAGIAQGAARQHFALRPEPPKPLECRGSSQRRGQQRQRGQTLKKLNDNQPAGLVQEVQELNAFIATVRLEGTQLRGWTRIFNAGDVPGFNWDRGGRLYARPNDSYQSLSKAERSVIRLNGEPVVEIDIRASHLHIVYGLNDQSLRERCQNESGWDDPYAIADLPRSVVKAWITAALGAGQHPGRWSSNAKKDLQEEGINLARYPIRKVKAAVLAHHPILSDLAQVSWATLQFIESQAIIGAMLELKRKHGIPALPVHDSLIVPRSAWQIAEAVLCAQTETHTGQAPLPPKTFPSREQLMPAAA